MPNLHLLIAGPEDKGKHLAGLAKLQADEVLLFVSKDALKADGITAYLDGLGVPFRILPVELDYLDCYRKASYEAAAAFTKGKSVGINLSTGPELLRAATEEAVRIQLYHFLRHTSSGEISAFKYFVQEGPQVRVVAVPIWDFSTFLHNDIFEILLAAKEPLTLAQIHQMLTKTMGRDAPKWEAFRKTFREFKRSFGGSLCFVEVVGKGPRYKIRMRLA